MFEKRRKEIAKRRAEIRAMLAGTDEVDMDALERELDDLDKEERELDRREAATRRLNGGIDPHQGERGGHGDRGSGDEGDPTPGPVNPITGRGGAHGEAAGGGLPYGVNSRAARMADLQGIGVGEVEARAQRFATEHRMEITTEALHRSLTLSGGNIAQPSRVSGINPGQNVVSGIVDMVRVVPADGMGEDSVAYEVSGGQTAATKKDDGSATPESTPNLKIAKIVPTLVTTLSYVSRNIQRTTPLNYQDRVSASALNALRAKTGTLIVTGNPAAGPVASGTEVELSSATDGARIYYTLDKSNPTQSSTLYENKITITEAVTIKAKAYADGHTASDVLTAEYTISG